LTPFTTLPAFLERLLLEQNPRARAFRDGLRHYNNLFAFTSVKCTGTTRGVAGNGPMAFQIQGTLYHLTGPLDSTGGSNPQFAQIYFNDPETATNARHLHSDGLDRGILSELGLYLQDYNPFIEIYVTAQERFRELQGQGRIILNPQMRLILEEGADRRRENLPTGNEVAAIIPDEREGGNFRDLVLAERAEDGSVRGFHEVHPYHPAYLALAYPLIFPNGDHGFHHGLQLRDLRNTGRKSNKLGFAAYCRYILHARHGQNSVPFAFRRLFQQFLVDLWAAQDQQKLAWLRNNQKHLRADLYQGVVDWIRAGDGDVRDLGQRVILPASYIGGDRFISQCYQDSMAIVRKLGVPTFFITVTANPNWPEIKRELLQGETALDRPDIVCRVFEEKSQALLRELRDGLFGKFAGIVWTMEYQKRGLPHRHILLFLTAEFAAQYKDVEIIDRVVSAEIPTPEEDPDGQLREIIASMMVHGPCGPTNPESPCMQPLGPDKIIGCSKRFPKPFIEATAIPEDGYPLYKRRDNGHYVVRQWRGQEIRFDNRFVVPYNPYLSRRYRAHVNVEICATIKAVKYINKYIYKGSDRATLELRDRNQPDEIATYLQCRYVGPSEAVVRLFEFPVHCEYPPVRRLPVHLPGEQAVYFDAGATEEELQVVLNRNTELMGFFEYNRLYEDGRNTIYGDFPSRYVWETKTRTWCRRQRGTSIGRVQYVPPAAGERYFLRLLLVSIPGAQSFGDLRTVDRVLHPTFRAACLAAGLLEDDRHWMLCFEEAASWQTGTALRNLFVMSLLHGDVSDPPGLWNKFREHLCDDLPRRIQREFVSVPPDLQGPHLDYGLFLIQRYLIDSGKTLADFALPAVRHEWDRSHGNTLLAAEVEFDLQEQDSIREETCNSFNAGQRRKFDEIVTAVATDPENAHFFVQGPGGTGKTFLYRGLAAHFRTQGKVVLCVASSGIAALLLPGGRTAHSRFKIPLQIGEDSTCNIKKSTQLSDLILRTALIIWDKVPMQHKHCFEAVHRTLQDIRGSDALFGGVPTVFGGDFAQILPVIKRGTRPQIVQACLQRSFLWSTFKVRHLTENMRVRGADPENRAFVQWLRDLSYESNLHGNLDLPPSICHLDGLDKLYSDMYPESLLARAPTEHTVFADRSILTARNTTVATINEAIVKKIPGPEAIFESSNTAGDAHEGATNLYAGLTPEFLQSLDFPSIPPARLTIKVGTPIMLLRNLFPREGLCNGTRLVVTRIGRRIIEGKILGGDFSGQLRMIPRIKLESSTEDFPFVISRTQFPVRPCFAMTINKSQGQSFKRIGVDLREPVFTHGQFYVAMSRVTDVKNLFVLSSHLRGNKKLQNIVYPEILLKDI